MKICIISGNLGSNAFGRAWILAKAVQLNHEVSIVGTEWGKGIWSVADLTGLELKSVKGDLLPAYRKIFRETVDIVEGDIIYAVKPKLSSFGVGLKAGKKLKVPVVLDIDDDETAFTEGFWNCWKPNSLRDPNAYLSTRLMESRVDKADALTVISEYFRNKFGRGIIIPHGRDTEAMDPDKFEGEFEKRKRGYEGLKLCVFLGTPRKHKGIEKILSAIRILNRKDLKLLIVGADSNNSYIQQLRETGGNDLILEPARPFSEIPEWLSIADVVVIPSESGAQSRGQVPAKLIDAMAMGRPIILSDIPVLRETAGESALYFNENDIGQLAVMVEQIIDDAHFADDLGIKARTRCIELFSLKAMSNKLNGIFHSVTKAAL